MSEPLGFVNLIAPVVERFGASPAPVAGVEPAAGTPALFQCEYHRPRVVVIDAFEKIEFSPLPAPSEAMMESSDAKAVWIFI